MKEAPVEALFAAGVAAQRAGDHATAVQRFEQALVQAPALAEARHNLALSCRTLGLFDRAEAEWRTLLQTAPDFALAPGALGNLLRAQAQQAAPEARARLLSEACSLHKRAVTLAPLEPGHAHNLFLTLSAAEAWEPAVDVFVRLAATHPQQPAFAELAARALVRIGRFEEARAQAEAALALNAADIEAHVSLASAWRELGHAAEAERVLERATALDPRHAVAAFNLAQLRCFRGRWAEGLAGIAADRVRQAAVGQLRGPEGATLWSGAAAPDSHLLLLAEQGLGDTLQLVRYAASARARVNRVTLAPPPGLPAGARWLSALLREVEGLDEVLAPGAPWPAVSHFAPLFSLPHLCRPVDGDIHAPRRYLNGDPRAVETWAQALGPRNGELRVAVAWQGNPQYRGDARRSMPLLALAPLFALRLGRPIRWLSVQKGFGAAQLAETSLAPQLENWGERLDLGPHSFTDTAAFLENVDLLISSDTSLPHLAGAVGLPTFMLLAAVPDWRWQESGETTPWYPSLRLFRQTHAGQWDTAVSRVVAPLTALAASR